MDDQTSRSGDLMVQDQQWPQPPEPATPAPAAPRSRWRWWMAAAIVLVGVAIALALLQRGPEPVAYVTEAANTDDLEQIVEAPAQVAFSPGASVTAVAPTDGVVTSVDVATGDRPDDLAVVATIADEPVFLLRGEQPLYRDLAEGDRGDDVEALETALDAAGHDPGEVDRRFDADTTAAVEQWQDEAGIDVTGRVGLQHLAWAPPNAAVVDVAAERGARVTAGDALAVFGVTGQWEVLADVAQGDITAVTTGDDVTVDLDATADPVSGTVASVAQLPASSDDETYEVTIQLDQASNDLRAGLDGTAQIVVDTREDVVVVPTGAVTSEGSSATVEVLDADGDVDTRRVSTGLVTAGLTEISDGVNAGDEIVIGEESQ